MAASVVLTEGMVDSAATKATRQLDYTYMKPEQLQVVAGILHSCDTLVVLPTGYGKSLCYACLPFSVQPAVTGRPDLVDKASNVVVIIPHSNNERSGNVLNPRLIFMFLHLLNKRPIELHRYTTCDNRCIPE